MSITVADCLRLPSLVRATVVAGRRGLGRQVTSVSVLEWLDVKTPAASFLLRHELVITSFYALRHDPDAQVEAIRWLHEAGEVGLIVYYVGVVLPELSPDVLRLADELDLPVICMPTGELNHRYSEAISEINFLIYQDQLNHRHFVQDLLQRFSTVAEQRQTMANLLRMLSDRLRASLILTDSQGLHWLSALWPTTLHLDSRQLLDGLDDVRDGPGESSSTVTLGTGGVFHLHRLTIPPRGRQLLLLSMTQPVPPDLQERAMEVVRLNHHLWQPESPDNHGPLLLEALLLDDPRQLEYAAEKLDIDPARFQHLIVIDPGLCELDAPLVLEALTTQSRAFLEAERVRAVLARRGGQLVALLESAGRRDPENEQADLEHLVQEWSRHLQLTTPSLWMSFLPHQRFPDELRENYRAAAAHMAGARLLYPLKGLYTGADLRMAQQVHGLLLKGGGELASALAPIRRLQQFGRLSAHLIQTLEAYLLDHDSRVEVTASALDLHVGTVKYRLKRVRQILGEDVYHLPHLTELYLAVATWRMGRMTTELSS